jgi:hypothetical protein
MLKKLLTILFIIFLILLIFLLVYFVNQRLIFTGRADNPGNPSLDNSYLFASPLIAQANGLEKIRVTVFVLDSQGSGVPGKTVTLGQSLDLNVEAIQPITDSIGKAVFDLSSNTSLIYELEVLVDGQLLPQKLRLTYR